MAGERLDLMVAFPECPRPGLSRIPVSERSATVSKVLDEFGLESRCHLIIAAQDPEYDEKRGNSRQLFLNWHGQTGEIVFKISFAICRINSEKLLLNQNHN